MTSVDQNNFLEVDSAESQFSNDDETEEFFLMGTSTWGGDASGRSDIVGE